MVEHRQVRPQALNRRPHAQNGENGIYPVRKNAGYTSGSYAVTVRHFFLGERRVRGLMSASYSVGATG